MCTPEKKAIVWSSYLNAQCQALWNIAKTCDDRDEEKCRFYRAFAAFDYSASEHSSGSQEIEDTVTFHPPELVFICNHTVILTLSVDTGTLTNVPTENDGDPTEMCVLS